MRRALYLLSLVLIVASISVVPSGASAGGRGHGHFRGHHHHFHGHHGPHVGFWFGSPFWWGPSVVYPPYPYYPYPPYPYYRERIVIVEEPQVYVERPRPSDPSGWWYYCESERAYYPDVERCPEPWIKVAPRSQ